MFIKFLSNKNRSCVAFRKSEINRVLMRPSPEFEKPETFSVTIKGSNYDYTVCCSDSMKKAFGMYLEILKHLNGEITNIKNHSLNTDI